GWRAKPAARRTANGRSGVSGRSNRARPKSDQWSKTPLIPAQAGIQWRQYTLVPALARASGIESTWSNSRDKHSPRRRLSKGLQGGSSSPTLTNGIALGGGVAPQNRTESLGDA